MLNREEKTIIKAAKRGGKVLERYFGKVLEIHQKTMRSDFYTRADTEAENAILDTLKSIKDCNIQAEESGNTDNQANRTLVIDPLDGTNNFSLEIPYFSVGIALKEGQETVFSVVYNPILDDLYYAKKGKGAFKNNDPIQVSRQKDTQELTIAYTSGYSNVGEFRTPLEYELYHRHIKRFLDNWCPTLDYCLLASGRIDAVIANDDDTGESSIGILLIKEAGGHLLNFAGGRSEDTGSPHFIAAGTKEAAEQLAEIVKMARTRNT